MLVLHDYAIHFICVWNQKYSYVAFGHNHDLSEAVEPIIAGAAGPPGWRFAQPVRQVRQRILSSAT